MRKLCPDAPIIKVNVKTKAVLVSCPYCISVHEHHYACKDGDIMLRHAHCNTQGSYEIRITQYLENKNADSFNYE